MRRVFWSFLAFAVFQAIFNTANLAADSDDDSPFKPIADPLVRGTSSTDLDSPSYSDQDPSIPSSPEDDSSAPLKKQTNSPTFHAHILQILGPHDEDDSEICEINAHHFCESKKDRTISAYLRKIDDELLCLNSPFESEESENHRLSSIEKFLWKGTGRTKPSKREEPTRNDYLAALALHTLKQHEADSCIVQ